MTEGTSSTPPLASSNKTRTTRQVYEDPDGGHHGHESGREQSHDCRECKHENDPDNDPHPQHDEGWLYKKGSIEGLDEAEVESDPAATIDEQAANARIRHAPKTVLGKDETGSAEIAAIDDLLAPADEAREQLSDGVAVVVARLSE